MPGQYYRSNVRLLRKVQIEVARAALVAATQVVVNQAKMNARGGFKGGRYVTQGWTSITFELIEDGFNMRTRVGSTLKHFMWWELGHHNAFTGRYERSEWLLPAVTTGRTLQQMAAKKAAKQVAHRYGVKGSPITVSGRSGGGRRSLPG